MNREDIIRMAVDAGIVPWTKHEHIGGNNFSASDEGLDGDLASLIQFAQLVADEKVKGMVMMTPDEFKTVWDKAQQEEHYGGQECLEAWQKDGSPIPEPKREWVGLTDEEIAELWLPIYASTPPSGIHEDGLVMFRLANAVEAKLKEKNFD